jgi:hypothetical protein
MCLRHPSQMKLFSCPHEDLKILFEGTSWLASMHFHDISVHVRPSRSTYSLNCFASWLMRCRIVFCKKTYTLLLNRGLDVEYIIKMLTFSCFKVTATIREKGHLSNGKVQTTKRGWNLRYKLQNKSNIRQEFDGTGLKFGDEKSYHSRFAAPFACSNNSTVAPSISRMSYEATPIHSHRDRSRHRTSP